MGNAGVRVGAGDQGASGAGPRAAGSWVWGGCVGVWACRGGGRARVRSYGGTEGDAEGGGLGLVVAVFLQGLLDGGAFDFLDADRTTGRGVHGEQGCPLAAGRRCTGRRSPLAERNRNRPLRCRDRKRTRLHSS